MAISILLMVATLQRPSTALSQTQGSPVKLELGCGAPC